MFIQGLRGLFTLDNLGSRSSEPSAEADAPRTLFSSSAQSPGAEPWFKRRATEANAGGHGKPMHWKGFSIEANWDTCTRWKCEREGNHRSSAHVMLVTPLPQPDEGDERIRGLVGKKLGEEL
jgi:hypothetical protein